jgi:cytochrome c oxidase subunit 2
MSYASGDPPQKPRRPHVRRVLIIWAVLSVICVALVLLLGSIVNPNSASDSAGFANTTNILFTAMAVPVGLFVWVFVGYSIVAFRQPTLGAEANHDDLPDGPPLEAKPRQQITWLAVTGGLAIFLVGWGMFGFYKQTTNLPPRPLVVDVTGQQWAWTYRYPSLGVSSDVLMLPVHRPVQFRVTSDDVLHGFVVNGLGVAMDANPGWWSTAPTVTPTKVGRYTTRCMELCGLYHTYMWSQVRVVTPSAFAAWVVANGGNAS